VGVIPGESRETERDHETRREEAREA